MEKLKVKSLPDMFNEALFCEMTEIGRIGQLVVYVWPHDGGEIPHFHIGDNNTFPHCTQFSTAIKIDKAEYFAHGGKYTDKLNSKQRKQLMTFLNSKSGIAGVTKWQILVEMWNSGDSKHKVYGSTPMPDYT